MTAQTHAAEHPLRPAHDSDIVVPKHYDPAAEHPLAYAQQDEPDWLPGLMQRLHRQGHKIRNHALLRWREKPAWLVIVSKTDYWEKLALYKITTPGEASLELMIKEAMVDLAEPTGTDHFGDGTPLLAVSYGSGGSAQVSYGVLALHLDDKVRDATPAQYYLHSFSKDGRTLIAWDNLAGLLGFECTDCSTHVLTSLRWNGKEYEKACDQTPWLYQQQDRPDHGDGLKDFRRYVWNRLGYAADLLQNHHSDEATAVYRDMLKKMVRKTDIPPDAIAEIKTQYGPIFLRPKISGACPLPMSQPVSEEISTLMRQPLRNYLDMLSPAPSPYHP